MTMPIVYQSVIQTTSRQYLLVPMVTDPMISVGYKFILIDINTTTNIIIFAIKTVHILFVYVNIYVCIIKKYISCN